MLATGTNAMTIMKLNMETRIQKKPTKPAGTLVAAAEVRVMKNLFQDQTEIRPRKTVKPEKESAKVSPRIERLVPTKIREGKRTGVRGAALETKEKWDRHNQQHIIDEASNHPKKEVRLMQNMYLCYT